MNQNLLLLSLASALKWGKLFRRKRRGDSFGMLKPEGTTLWGREMPQVGNAPLSSLPSGWLTFRHCLLSPEHMCYQETASRFILTMHQGTLSPQGSQNMSGYSYFHISQHPVFSGSRDKAGGPGREMASGLCPSQCSFENIWFLHP